MARSVRWPWGLLILILSLPGEHGVGASAASLPPGDSCNSHASSAAGKNAVEIIGGLLSGVIFVGALYRLAAEVAPSLRFFICHTGGINQEGKNFPERLYDEMTQSLKLKFFITVFFDRMVLLDGLPFPPQILKELERTQVGIVLVTPDFFTRKWPMVELVYFVESSERSSNMRRVLPLFYRMTVRQVQDNLRDGVWEAEWRKMSTHGDHPLSVERCRHAVCELCKYKGVEYSGSDHDRGRDKEYIREILKRVGKIVCEEIWKSDRAKDLVNSSLRGHPPERSGEVIELAPLLEPEPPSPQPLSTVAPPPPIVAPSPSFSDNDHLTPQYLPAPQAPPLGPEPPSLQPSPLVAPPPLVVAPSSSFNNGIYLASIIFLASQVPLPGRGPPNPHPPPHVAPPSLVVAPSSNFNNDGDIAFGTYLAPQTPPGPEPPSPHPPLPLVAPNSSFSPPSLHQPKHNLLWLATTFPRRLRFFISHPGGSERCSNFPDRLYDEMTKRWKLKFFTRVFLDRRSLRLDMRFPQQMLLELEKTDFGMVFITKDYFTHKWPMLQLVSFVESYERNPVMRGVIPLFYGMTPTQVRDNLKDGVWEGDWTEMSTHGNHPLSVERYRHAVETLCQFKGVEYYWGDRGYEEEFIREILKLVDKRVSINAMWKMLIELLSW